jgi:nucleotide-binding universal stress UspA family protein
MRQFELERILCAIDSTEASGRQLKYAGAVAGWSGGRVTALHAAPAPTPTAAPAGRASPAISGVPREQAMHRLREAVSSAGIDERNATFVVEEGEPATTIVEQARTLQADIVVMGTHHGGSPFDSPLLGAVTERVLREAPCPVLTVPPHAPPDPPEEPRFEPILCAIDFSPSSVKSFRYADEIGRRTGAPVVVVHAIEWLAESEPADATGSEASELRERLVDDARKQLAQIVMHQGVGSRDVTTIVTVGRAHREILRLANEKDAALIVMGAQGRSGAALALFGSTTHQVVSRASCPVLTAR